MLADSSTCCELYSTDIHNTLCTLNSCSFTREHKTHGVFRILIIVFYVVFEWSTKRGNWVSDHRIIQRIRVLRTSRGSWSSMPPRPPITDTQSQRIPGRRRTLCDIASREIMRTLLRCSCGALSPHQAIQSTTPELNSISPTVSTIGKCWLALAWRTNLSVNPYGHLHRLIAFPIPWLPVSIDFERVSRILHLDG